MKEGVLNEKLTLFKLLSYMKSVYHIPQKIRTLTDKRKRRSIPLFNIVMPTLIFLMLQYRSFHTVFSSPESMNRRLRNCIRGKMPKVDAVRDLLSGFHQLKTYYHLKHCYCHKAVETVFYLIIIAFNMKELYLYRRTKDFKGRKITLISVSRMFQDELHMKNMKNVLYESEKGG